MMDIKFKEEIESRGSNFEEVSKQLEILKSGLPFMELNAPATPTKGIISLSPEQHKIAIERYDKKVSKGEAVIKFVPASGAASRMFQKLFQFLEECSNHKEASSAIKAGRYPEIEELFKGITTFAFYSDLEATLKDDIKIGSEFNYIAIISNILGDSGLNYGSLPKGLLKFHKYSSGSRTPMAEHLYEAMDYAKSGDNICRLHFTVSPEHLDLFKAEATAAIDSIEIDNRPDFEITYSKQKPSTDTVASTLDGEPFIDDKGEVLFRPGGHGALLENLNDLDADIVFIKNIDNVTPDKLSPITTKYKKLIGGTAIDVRDKTFSYLLELDKSSSEISDKLLAEILEYIKDIFCYTPAEDTYYMEKSRLIPLLKGILNRPIRVCGVVKNLGEPGGGPFICGDADGSLSPQIVESSQVDMDNPDQREISASATHFNPVDLVCSVKNYRGEKFDLLKYRNDSAAFISTKSKQGRSLKALELPGLWNGAMAYWNTIFIEVPVDTFNPVKTVNDLLRDAHLA